jgi:hypothetical protein
MKLEYEQTKQNISNMQLCYWQWSTFQRNYGTENISLQSTEVTKTHKLLQNYYTSSHLVQWKPHNLCVPVVNHHLSSPKPLTFMKCDTEVVGGCSDKIQFWLAEHNCYITWRFTIRSGLFWDSTQCRLVVCNQCIPGECKSHSHHSRNKKSHNIYHHKISTGIADSTKRKCI